MKLLLTEEFAERVRTTPATIRYWRSIGYGPVGCRIGRRVMYDEAAVDAWLAEQMNRGGAA